MFFADVHPRHPATYRSLQRLSARHDTCSSLRSSSVRTCSLSRAYFSGRLSSAEFFRAELAVLGTSLIISPLFSFFPPLRHSPSQQFEAEQTLPQQLQKEKLHLYSLAISDGSYLTDGGYLCFLLHGLSCPKLSLPPRQPRPSLSPKTPSLLRTTSIVRPRVCASCLSSKISMRTFVANVFVKGAYRDDNGKPVVLECVREAERLIAGNLHMEYLPMGGSSQMIEESLKLVYGEDSDFVKDKKIAAVQALSGTSACRVFADFQKRFLPDSQIYILIPTWSNHHNIWRDARIPLNTFHYYHAGTKELDFSSLMEDIKLPRYQSSNVLPHSWHGVEVQPTLATGTESGGLGEGNDARTATGTNQDIGTGINSR